MALRNILREGDPTLAKKSRPVTEVTDRIRTILDDMADTMHAASGVGLAAPQVGVLRRIFIVEVEEGKLFELINPEVVEADGDQYGEEGCLSVPGYVGNVHRPEHVKIRGIDRNGKPVEYEGEGLLARAFMHEYDHLDGILYTAKADNVHIPKEDE